MFRSRYIKICWRCKSKEFIREIFVCNYTNIDIIWVLALCTRSLVKRQSELFDELSRFLKASLLKERLCVFDDELPFVLIVCKGFLEDVPGEERQVDCDLICVTSHGYPGKSQQDIGVVARVTIDALGKDGATSTRPASICDLTLHHRAEVRLRVRGDGCTRSLALPFLFLCEFWLNSLSLRRTAPSSFFALLDRSSIEH